MVVDNSMNTRSRPVQQLNNRAIDMPALIGFCCPASPHTKMQNGDTDSRVAFKPGIGCGALLGYAVLTPRRLSDARRSTKRSFILKRPRVFGAIKFNLFLKSFNNLLSGPPLYWPCHGSRDSCAIRTSACPNT